MFNLKIKIMATINKTRSKTSSRTRTKTERIRQASITAIDEKIVPFLWFNGNAEEAMNFYISIFKNSKTLNVTRYLENGGGPKGAVMTCTFRIEGHTFYALNSSSEFTFSPSNSFYVSCKTLPEIKRLWDRLTEGGSVRMELDKYPFSKRYGWLQDKFGVSWQLILTESTTNITPFLMFSGKYQGMAEEAINFYTSVFKKSGILNIMRYNEEYQGPTGKVVHAEFKLNGQKFMAMDSAIEMEFIFSPAISYFVYCKTQKEVDDYWEKLSEGGSIMQCGRLTDKFGVTWQIVPTILIELLNDNDPVKAGRVMNAMMQMVKLDIKGLKNAYNQH
jgi:predicted 3-demethylubiquinone-9 3-methyltransferase (glyoxalase superfamily)